MGISLWQFMCEGGWGMWSVLLFGGIALGGGLRYSIRPNPRALAFTAIMWFTCFTATVHAIFTNVAAVLQGLEDPERVSDAQLVRILVQGLKEASRPGTLSGILLTIVLLCIAIGILRSRSETTE